MSAEILSCVREFYTLEAINTLQRAEPFKHSHQKWLQDFNAYRETYAAQFAQAIFDYTAMVVYGEMRHGRKRASHYNPNVVGGSGRVYAYENALSYTPESIFLAGIPLFECEWEHDYGGKKWIPIARAGLMFDRLGTFGFIDHCVDLSHNSGPYFNKPDTHIFSFYSGKNPDHDFAVGRYTRYLSHKTNTAYLPGLITVVSATLRGLIRRGSSLGILHPSLTKMTFARHAHQKSINFIRDYSPKVWGSVALKDNLVPTYNN